MDRRIGTRISTDFRLTAHRNGVRFEHRAIDLSATGALIRSRQSHRRPPLVQHLELEIGALKPLKTLARTVWADGKWQGVRFVGLSDVDRLDIAEHIDAVEGRGRCSSRLR
ncbi:MAG: PilZ domain-containing protein [Deltaproteobacteria bacterium]|nr:PilZ domain-containing protein [Deltaproteobacteria bacterium]